MHSFCVFFDAFILPQNCIPCLCTPVYYLTTLYIGSALRAALAETAAPASLQLATAHGYRNVPVTDVLFLERILRKTRVVLTDGEELVTAAPAALLEAVPDGVFLRCHQSYWANFSHITAMEKDEFVLTGGLRVPISRSYRSAARSAFFANLRGEEG